MSWAWWYWKNDAGVWVYEPIDIQEKNNKPYFVRTTAPASAQCLFGSESHMRGFVAELNVDKESRRARILAQRLQQVEEGVFDSAAQAMGLTREQVREKINRPQGKEKG